MLPNTYLIKISPLFAYKLNNICKRGGLCNWCRLLFTSAFRF